MFNPEGVPKSPAEKPQLLEDKQWRSDPELWVEMPMSDKDFAEYVDSHIEAANEDRELLQKFIQSDGDVQTPFLKTWKDYLKHAEDLIIIGEKKNDTEAVLKLKESTAKLKDDLEKAVEDYAKGKLAAYEYKTDFWKIASIYEALGNNEKAEEYRKIAHEKAYEKK